MRLHGVVVCLASMFAVSCAVELDPSCLSRRPGNHESGCRRKVDKDDALLVGGDERNGVVHFRVAYDPDSGVDPLQWKAFQEGMSIWNRHRKETGFHFEVATPGDPVDFWFRRGAPGHLPQPHELEKAGCAGYASPGSYIWYSSENMAWVKGEADIVAAARIYAHELGHTLNLCHKHGIISIMREGDPAESCRDRAFKSPLDIQTEDLLDARFCGQGARAKARAHRAANAITPLDQDAGSR
jgi:hypothetical protein